MKKYFAVSDVHSFYSDMMEALNSKGYDKHNPEHIVVICGDAFDRGDESSKMFKWLKHQHKNNRLIYVRGNHEDLIIKLVEDIEKLRHIGTHHISNGTLKTISDIMDCSKFDILNNCYNKKIFANYINDLITFIDDVTVDYFELGKTVFVHGWVPTTSDNKGQIYVHENWRDGGWNDARWDNGMEMFHFDILPPDKEMIVCGHWHTSFGWSNYEKKCSEWNEDAIFDPYIKYSKDCKHLIVAIDGCTAYTRQVNCVVFDEAGNILD